MDVKGSSWSIDANKEALFVKALNSTWVSFVMSVIDLSHHLTWQHSICIVAKSLQESHLILNPHSWIESRPIESAHWNEQCLSIDVHETDFPFVSERVAHIPTAQHCKTTERRRRERERERREMRATAAGRAAGVQSGAGGAERSGIRRSDGGRSCLSVPRWADMRPELWVLNSI